MTSESSGNESDPVLIVARDNNHRLLLGGENGVLRLEAQSEQIGAVQEEVSTENGGGSVQIAFNAVYLLDLLRVMDDEEFHLEVLGPTNPGAIRPCEGDGFVYILMPMQI